ncbi:hypothetical protein ACOSP7_023655 [Xanthoceras sorbifolium]|uniref:Filament-like plant protein 3 n=1 Tax=Xanthoceras sorbifolium TaxID=99658 RepID=A0ABQ8HRQ3_9ROSI|nr:hypothetical protein JRO89_XS08G0257800 [Xanthoceras sorbifolium]
MDRRSWLWRRKSSEKSPGETESSGSVSSLSERFSDDQACPTHSSQSPEITSKAVTADEEYGDNVKTLTEKLSAALLNISAKEDLVKQHAKVAEEAVSGWEKAENEVSTLKQQLETAGQKNSALENRVGHLDGALKECVRQLRQAREEQDQKIQEAVTMKTRKWESAKSELENQLVNLQKQLQTAKTEAAASVDLDHRSKLEAADKENSALKFELLSRTEELEIRIIERDLSTQAAETASKQHLESIKKLAKLEAECRRLKAVARKTSPMSDQKSFTTSSIYIESFTDSQSDSGERLQAVENVTNKMSGLETSECEPSRFDSSTSVVVTELDQFTNEKALGRNFMVPSVEINLMDDFLEMERLAALPDTESGSYCPEVELVSYQQNANESSIKAKLEIMVHRNAELKEKLEKTEAKKVEVETALIESEKQLQKLQNWVKESEQELVELQTQLALANDLKQAVEVEMKAANVAKEVAESQLRIVEAEMKTQLALAKKSRQAVEEEVKIANATKAAAESRLGIVEAEMKDLRAKVASLEEEVDKERTLSAENFAVCQKLKDQLSKMKDEAAKLKHEANLWCLGNSNEELKIKQEKELAVAASKFAECQKTIASLGQQLRSLTTLEDFLIDSEKPMDLTGEGLQSSKNGEQWNLHSSDSCFVK